MVQPIDKPLAITPAFTLGRKEGEPPAYIPDAFSLGLHDGGDSDVPERPIPPAVSLPSLSPKPAATLINAHALMLNSLMQGKKLPVNTYLPNQVLEDADLLNHSFALEKQAHAAAALNQEAVGNLSTSLQQHQALASKAILPQQQAWHLHKGLQLLQEAKEDGLVPPPDAERLGDHFKRSLAQAQANLLLNTAPHSIRQALHSNPLLVELNDLDRQRIEQRAERRLHSLPLDQQQQQQQALLQQTGNRLKGWANRSYDYINQAQSGQLPPSKLADLELTQSLPKHTLNLLAQLSTQAVTQSAKYQSYLNRMEQGLTTKPLNPNNPDDMQAADYHFLLNHGKDSDQQLSATLPNLFRLTSIIPKSAQPAVNRLIHGKEGVKFSQSLAEAWQQNPSLASQLSDEVLLHNFTAHAILPNWQQSGITDDPQNRVYYLLTNPTLPPMPDSKDPATLGAQTAQRIIALHQMQTDLKTLEYAAAHHPDPEIQARLQPLIQARRDTLAQLSADPKNAIPQTLRIQALTAGQLNQQLGIVPGDGAFASPSLAVMPRLPLAQQPDWRALGFLDPAHRDPLFKQLFSGLTITINDQNVWQDEDLHKFIQYLSSLSPDQLQHLPPRMAFAISTVTDPGLGKFLNSNRKDWVYMSNATRNDLLRLVGLDPEALGFPDKGSAGYIDTRPATKAVLGLFNQALDQYKANQISYAQFIDTLKSLESFRIDQAYDTLSRLVHPGQPNPNFILPNMVDKGLSGIADVASTVVGSIPDTLNWLHEHSGSMAAADRWTDDPENFSPLPGSEDVRNILSGVIPQVTAETLLGSLVYNVLPNLPLGGLGARAMITSGLSNTASQLVAELGGPTWLQFAAGLLADRSPRYATAGAGSLGKLQITSDLKPNLDLHFSQGNNPGNKTNIPGHNSYGNSVTPSTTNPGNPATTGNITTPGNPAIALNPTAGTPGNTQLNPSTQPSITSGQTPINPNQQLITSTQSQNPLQNIKRTIYTIHDIPSIHDTTPVPRRTLPNYTPQELEIFRNHTSDWHTNFNWNAELFDLIDGHGGNHIYDTPKMIADRMLNPQPGAYIPTASSRTFDANAAEYFIKETLYHNSNIIDNWLLIPAPNKGLVLKYIPSSGELTGFGIPRGGTNFMPTYNMKVVIVRTQNGYRLHTYYPGFK